MGKETMNVTAQVMNLPILKHLDSGAIAKNAENQINKFRKGEKPVYNLLRLGAIGIIGFLSFKYIIPKVFEAFGIWAYYTTIAVLITGTILFAPLLFKWLKRMVRKAHEKMIGYDPFGELYRQFDLQVSQKRDVSKNKGTILNIKSDMEINADVSEKNAKKLEGEIITASAKAQKLKAELTKMENEHGPSIKGEDDYVNKTALFSKTISEATRLSSKFEQEKGLVQKYGSRAVIMKKIVHKLTMVETAMEIKLGDFEATIDILKKDYEFAQKAKNATDSAKSVLGLTKTWELEYALDVVTNTIAEDISITAVNLKDIDSLTLGLNMDNDEQFDKLNLLVDNIKIGNSTIPSAKKYANPEYELTREDRIKSGGLENIF